MIEDRGQTALLRYHAHVRRTLIFIQNMTYDIDFPSQASYGHDPHTHTKTQRSVNSKDKVETHRRTDGRYGLLYLPG